MKGPKVLLPIFVACCWILGSPLHSGAHYIQTHQKMISLAKSALSTASPYDKIHAFLEAVDGSTGKTYLRRIMEGVRDADMLANGLYRVDCHAWNPCWDWDLTQNDSRCYPVITLPNSTTGYCNDIAYWPVVLLGSVMTG